MKRAAQKRYFTPREQDPAPMHADPAYPPQSNLNQPYYPPQPQRVAPAGPRICHVTNLSSWLTKYYLEGGCLKMWNSV